MSKKFLLYGLTLGCLVAILAPAATQAQTCEPLNNGRLANVFHEGTALFFEPVVEYRTMTLTIGGPCEDIVKVFGPKDQISFDIREIERVTDGQYTWELHREATVDEGVQKELQASRGSGEEDALWWSFFQKGLIPEGPYVDSGSFTVERGQIIDPNSGEEKSASLAGKDSRGGSASAIQATLAGGLGSGDSGEDSGGPVLATKDTVLTNANGVIRNSLCVGFDCLNNNTYSDSTILLTENNTRIKFDDTSTASSFPRNDWEIQANSNANGGGNWLGFNDCGQNGGGADGGGCADDLVFAVEAGVRQHALYVESDGDIGVGTANPVVRMHLVDGDTPALRLEQDGSSGFAPQVWDLAGNETSFFVRDATNGSTLPFRIFPGASSNSLIIDDTNDIGVGTISPQKPVHIVRGTNPGFRLQDNSGTGASNWDFELNANGLFQINKAGTGGAEVLIRERGGTDPNETMDVDGEIEADAFNLSSSRHVKTAFQPVDSGEILARVLQLPVSEWTYRKDAHGARHIGPMAEDFTELFGVGNSSTNISVGDASGVALAAIQGLHQELQAKEAENAELRSRQEMLEARLQELEERFDSGTLQK